MRSLPRAVALCLLLLSPPLAAELLPIVAVEAIARQAPFIVKGKVLADFHLQVETQYKSELPNETIAVPDLSAFSDLVKTQWANEGSFSVFLIRSKLSEETRARLKEHGLVGSTVIVLLEQAEDGESYALKGTMLQSPESNYKHAAIKLLADDVVLRFGQLGSDDPVELVLDRDVPTLENLEAAIRYDRPLLLRLGYAVSLSEHYFFSSLTNLTNEAIRVDLATNMTLTIKGNAIEEETELPKEPWGMAKFPEVLEAGQPAFLRYVFNKLDPEVLQLEEGKEYEGTLTIRIPKDGEGEVYSAKAVAKIPLPTPPEGTQE